MNEKDLAEIKEIIIKGKEGLYVHYVDYQKEKEIDIQITPSMIYIKFDSKFNDFYNWVYAVCESLYEEKGWQYIVGTIENGWIRFRITKVENLKNCFFQKQQGESMTISNAIMFTKARVSFEDKWLYYDEETKEWVVCQRRTYAKKTVELIRVPYLDEEKAVEALLKKDS
jgi:hypothetical protein